MTCTSRWASSAGSGKKSTMAEPADAGTRPPGRRRVRRRPSRQTFGFHSQPRRSRQPRRCGRRLKGSVAVLPRPVAELALARALRILFARAPAPRCRSNCLRFASVSGGARWRRPRDRATRRQDERRPRASGGGSRRARPTARATTTRPTTPGHPAAARRGGRRGGRRRLATRAPSATRPSRSRRSRRRRARARRRRPPHVAPRSWPRRGVSSSPRAIAPDRAPLALPQRRRGRSPTRAGSSRRATPVLTLSSSRLVIGARVDVAARAAAAGRPARPAAAIAAFRAASPLASARAAFEQRRVPRARAAPPRARRAWAARARARGRARRPRARRARPRPTRSARARLVEIWRLTRARSASNCTGHTRTKSMTSCSVE